MPQSILNALGRPAMSPENPNVLSLSGKEDEPWIDLPTESDFAHWSKEDEIAFNQRNRQIERWRCYAQTFDYLESNGIVGDYFEFGCHRVRTFRMALTEARRHFFDSMAFYAFDSFEGLPPTSSGPDYQLWRQPGFLKTSEEEFRKIVDSHGIYRNKIETIKGFYDNSLNETLKNRLSSAGVKASFICIDCDLYESAKPVFAFIEPFLQQGTVVYIDDLFVGYKGSPMRGVARAFLEFQQTSIFKFVQHMQSGWWGRSYIAYLLDHDTDMCSEASL